MTAGSAARPAYCTPRGWRALGVIALVWLVAAGIIQGQKTSAPDAAGVQAWLAQTRLETRTEVERARIAVALGRVFCRLAVAERARLIESAEFDRTLRAMHAGELRALHELAVPAGICGVLLDARGRPESERPAAFAASVRRARDHLLLDDERASGEAVRRLVERGLAAFAALACAEERLAAAPLIDRLRAMFL